MEKLKTPFQPKIGQPIMVLTDEGHNLCTYLGMDILRDKVNHVYYHNASGDKLYSEEQIALRLSEAYAMLN